MVRAVLRYTVLVAALAVMAGGALVVAGRLTPVNVPEEWRVATGIVVFLYGLYRFVITFLRRPSHARDR